MLRFIRSIYLVPRFIIMGAIISEGTKQEKIAKTQLLIFHNLNLASEITEALKTETSFKRTAASFAPKKEMKLVKPIFEITRVVVSKNSRKFFKDDYINFAMNSKFHRFEFAGFANLRRDLFE